MIQSLFIINSTGEVIIEKHWRGNVSRALCDVFWAEVVRYGSRVEDVPPVLAASTCPPGAAGSGGGDGEGGGDDNVVKERPASSTAASAAAAAATAAAAGALIHLHRHGLYLLAAVGLDTPPLETVSFLESLASVLEAYLGELSEHSIKDHFITVYELLDEMVDNGRPHTTEVCVLQELVEIPSVVGRVFETVAAAAGGGTGGGGGRSTAMGAPGRPPGVGNRMGGTGGMGGGPGIGGVPSASSVVSAATSAVTSAVSSAAATAAQGTAAFAQNRLASAGAQGGLAGVYAGYAGGGGGFIGGGGGGGGMGGGHRSMGYPPAGWGGGGGGGVAPLLLPWRRTGVVHPQNEIFVDIVEEVDTVMLGRFGTPLHALVAGRIDVRAALSGMPHVTMTLSGGDAMDDAAPHRCVKTRDNGVRHGPPGGGVLSFVPPDGAFTLLEYVVRGVDEVLLPLRVEADLSFAPAHDGRGAAGGLAVSAGGCATGTLSLELTPFSPSRNWSGGPAPFQQSIVSDAGGAMLEGVTAVIHLPAGVAAVTPTPAAHTSASFDPLSRSLTWTVGQVASGFAPRLHATLVGRPGERTPVASGTAVVVEWRLPSTAVTGLHVDSLTVTGESYKPYKGLRCVTKSGRYELRL
ncbi:hypothetical protein MMPV_003161 [Pyropia vietnamensis]